MKCGFTKIFGLGLCIYTLSISCGMTGDSVPKTPSIKVSGVGLHLFEGRPESGVLKNPQTVKQVENTITQLLANSSRVAAPEKLCTSMELELALPDNRTITILASNLCEMEGKWYTNEGFRDVSILVLRGLASEQGFVWCFGAVNTPYPTEEDRRQLIIRITSPKKPASR